MPTEGLTTARHAEKSAAVDGANELSGPSKRAVVRRAAREFRHDNLTTLAAALTYYAALSVVPGLIVLISVVGWVGHDATSRVTSQVESLVPGSSAAFVDSLIIQAQHYKGGAGITAIVGLVIALWSTSSYVNAFRQASNIIYGIGEGRPIWKTIPLRLGVTVVSVFVLVVGAAIVVVSGSVANQVGNAVGAGWAAVVVWDVVKWPLLLVLVSVLLAVLFWASPNAKQGGIRWISPGGMITHFSLAGSLGSFRPLCDELLLIRKDVRILGRGRDLLGLVVVGQWALLLGAEVNAEFEHARAMAEGLPEDVRPFAEPRDARKLDEGERQAVENAQAARRS